MITKKIHQKIAHKGGRNYSQIVTISWYFGNKNLGIIEQKLETRKQT